MCRNSSQRPASGCSTSGAARVGSPASVVIVHASLLKGAPGGRLALKRLTLPPVWAAPTNIHHRSPNLCTFGSPMAIRFRTGAKPAAVSKICTGPRFSIAMRRP